VALDQNTLKTELLKLFDENDPLFVGWPATVADAATNWGNAYNTYAMAAQDVSGDILATPNLAGFTGTLTGQLATSVDAVSSSLAFDTAFVAFWTGAIFAVGIPPTPVPILPTGAACPNVGGTLTFVTETTSIVSLVAITVLSSLLQPVFSVQYPDAASAADAISAAFHTATISAVTVLITGVDPLGAPVTNLCTIY
jgi:hypothetical protein